MSGDPYFHPNRMEPPFGISGLGRERFPVAFKASSLSPELLAYLQECSIFTCPEADLCTSGFESCCDHPRIPGHTYYEGYFHGLHTPTPMTSLNPRFGALFDKPAAPVPLRAFAQALRKCNASWIVACFAGDDAASALFRELLEKGFVFADMAVQVHFGDAVPADAVGWHRDSFNSTLHCAVSIRGERVLHARFHEAAQLVDYHDEARVAATLAPQREGDVYVSCPYAFGHGVQYPACAWADRTVAVQLRWLLVDGTLEALADIETEAVMDMMRVLATALRGAAVTMPTLAQVLEEAESLEPPVAPKSVAPKAPETSAAASRDPVTGCTIL